MPKVIMSSDKYGGESFWYETPEECFEAVARLAESAWEAMQTDGIQRTFQVVKDEQKIMEETREARARIWAVGYSLKSLRALRENDHYGTGSDYRERVARRKAVEALINEREKEGDNVTQ